MFGLYDVVKRQEGKEVGIHKIEWNYTRIRSSIGSIAMRGNH